MSRSFSVLVFATQHMPTGGIESHLQEFCFRLSDSGIKVDLVILNSAMLPTTETYFRKICRNVFLGNHGKSYKRIFWLLLVKMKLIAHRYDAIYTNGQGETIILFSKLFSRNGKWVHHHHTSGDAADRSTWGRGYHKALTEADVVIACSGRNAGEIALALDRPIQSIPCFSRQVSFSTQRKETEKLRFGYYGRLIPEKGIDLLCRLSEDKDFNTIELHIWGEGDAYPESFFSSHPGIHYHGAFSGKTELNSVIGSLDAYLLLSSHPEGLPIALLEVMSAGLPWLATDRGGIPDIVCDPLATRVIPASLSYEEIKVAILDLADAIKKGKLDRQRQRDLYEKKFSYKVLVQRWREVLGLYVDSNTAILQNATY